MFSPKVFSCINYLLDLDSVFSHSLDFNLQQITDLQFDELVFLAVRKNCHDVGLLVISDFTATASNCQNGGFNCETHFFETSLDWKFGVDLSNICLFS